MKTGSLRELIRAREFLHMPAVYDPLGGLLVQNSGFKVCFVGGYVTGAALAISEPLLTMTEQVALAGAVANAIDVPLIADAGAGWGDALHTMRTVREFCKAGVAGVHIGRDRNTARATLGQGMAVSAFPRYVPV